jgi:hypothetical protein
MSTPATLVLPQLEFDPHLYTATAILNPAIVLLSVGSHLDILLARDHKPVAERDYAFRAARRIRLPHGWRARAAEFASRFVRFHISKETLFNDLVITGFGKAFIPGDDSDLKERIDFPGGSLRLKPLTGEEYRRLSKMRGRELRRQIMRMFRLHRPTQARRSLELLKRIIPNAH